MVRLAGYDSKYNESENFESCFMFSDCKNGFTAGQ